MRTALEFTEFENNVVYSQYLWTLEITFKCVLFKYHDDHEKMYIMSSVAAT